MSKTWYNITPANVEGSPAEVLLYDVIGAWGVSAKQFAEDLKASAGSAITLRINSPGGDVMEGAAIYNILRSDGRQVTVHIDGLAASMASVVAMAGHKVVMPANALMMIHNPWTVAMGDADQLRKDADLLDKVKAQIVGAYQAKCGDKKTHEQLVEMMDAETWLDGAEAVAAGLADECGEAIKVAACAVDASKFAAKVDARLVAIMPKIETNGAGDAGTTPNDSKTSQPNQLAPVVDAAVFESRLESEKAQARAEGAAGRDAEVKALRDELALVKAEAEKMVATVNEQKATIEAERKARQFAEKAHATLLGGATLKPNDADITWDQALKDHGYEKARKLYPAAYDAFMLKNAPGLKQARK